MTLERVWKCYSKFKLIINELILYGCFKSSYNDVKNKQVLDASLLALITFGRIVVMLVSIELIFSWKEETCASSRPRVTWKVSRSRMQRLLSKYVRNKTMLATMRINAVCKTKGQTKFCVHLECVSRVEMADRIVDVRGSCWNDDGVTDRCCRLWCVTLSAWMEANKKKWIF